MAKVFHISVSDLRMLKHGTLDDVEKTRLMEQLTPFGIDESFVKQMDEDDFEAILEMVESTSKKVKAGSGTIPKEINWVGVVAIVLAAIVIMMLLLDITRPESVRELEEDVKNDLKQMVEPESVNSSEDEPKTEGARKDKTEPELKTESNDASKPHVSSEVQNRKSKQKDNDPEGSEKPVAEDPVLEKKVAEDEPGATKNSEKSKTIEPEKTTLKPEKTYVAVASAKVIMEEALNKSKYTPADVPRFNGGKAGLERYVKQKVGQIEHDKVDFGYRSVIVTFEVSPKGKVDNVQLMAGLSPELDKKTLEIIRNMPDWSPGKRVKMKYQLAVKYK